MRGARLEARDEVDLLGQHRLLPLELRLLVLLGQRPLLLVEGIVAGKFGQAAAVDLDHLVDDAVHEFAVVRGHHQRAVIAGKELLQPDQAFEVEMVARLVQQHHVGAHQQDAAQCHAHLPAAGEFADIGVHHLLAEAQAVQHLAGAAVQRVAAQRLEPRLCLAVVFDDGVQPVGLVRVGHRGFQRRQLGRHRADRAGALHHRGDRAVARHLANVLAEQADADAALDQDLTLVGLLLPGDQAEQRGLAGTVGTNEAGLLALLQGGRGLDEDQTLAVLLADCVQADHGSSGGRGGRQGVCARPGINLE